MEKIKVCCFCERWESGGIESFLSNVIHRLDLERVQVDIAAACLAGSVFTEPLQRLGVRFFELSGRQRSLVENHRQFLALLRRERYHVVHLNLFQGLALAYAGTARRAGVPVRIAHSHNTGLRKSGTRPLKLLVHNMAKYIFAREATAFWACSREAAGFLFPKGALNRRGYRFIPNGIEVERFRFDPAVREQVRGELGVEGQFVIGHVGRLCDQKNQDFLLEVFAQVKRRRPESRLLLVGEGELLGRLKEKAGELGVAESVIFYGPASRVERLLWAMDVFAFPSRFEGLGIAAVEAQAAGTPVAASEFVPDEACAGPIFRRLSLDAGAYAWADALLGACRPADRASCADRVKEAGFDISGVARQLEGCFVSGEMQ
jgi:glycosyltransferase involved in cell wall biosynthesis